MPLLAVVLPNLWHQPSLFKEPAPSGLANTNFQRSTLYCAQVQVPCHPFKDQDHDSGCLDRMWQVSVLEMATLPPWSISYQTLSAKSFCTPCSCPPSKQC